MARNGMGSNNTAVGQGAAISNDGNDNAAVRFRALLINSTSNDNTAVGSNALITTTTSNNIGLGFEAGQNLTTGSNNIDIGNPGVAGESNTIRIGQQGTQNGTGIAGIYGATVASGVGVIVGPNGRLGTLASSAHFKEAIKPMDKASETIFALKPVTFHYKKEIDAEGIPQFGLVAEDVETGSPHLVARAEQGKQY